MIDLDDLEAKAKAATPARHKHGLTHIYSEAAGGVIAGFLAVSDAEFSSAANPATVPELIRELREARAASGGLFQE